MISNTDSMLFVYSTGHIRVKVYKGRGPRQRFQSACGDAPSDAFLAGAIQSAARSRRGDERNSAVAFVPRSRPLFLNLIREEYPVICPHRRQAPMRFELVHLKG